MIAAVMAWALMQLSAGQRVLFASVRQTSGSVPGKIGARLAMFKDSQWQGTVVGAGLEMKVLSRCKELLEEHTKPYGEVLRYGLNKGAKGYEVTPLDSLCGGQVTLAVEVLIPMPHVLLMGGGHCGQAIAHSLDALGWNHSVHDTHSEFANLEKYPNAKHHFPVTVESFLPAKILNQYVDFRIYCCSVMIGVKTKTDFSDCFNFSENKAIPDGRSALELVLSVVVQNGKPSKKNASTTV